MNPGSVLERLFTETPTSHYKKLHSEHLIVVNHLIEKCIYFKKSDNNFMKVFTTQTKFFLLYKKATNK